MSLSALEKVVRRVIVPRNSIIVDYKVYFEDDPNFGPLFTVYYDFDCKEEGEKISELVDITVGMFNMLGLRYVSSNHGKWEDDICYLELSCRASDF